MKMQIHVNTLVVDDDSAICNQVRDWLTAEAFDVSAFTDPIAAVQYVARTPCDLGLIDLRMPDMDSTRFIRALLDRNPQMRVVIMAAFPEVEEVRRAMDAGARDMLAKPLEQERLLAALDRQLLEIGVPGRTEKHFNRRLGGRLRELRQASHRTQNEIARTAGITAAQLSQIELGKTATTTWTLARICGAMKLPLSTLFQI